MPRYLPDSSLRFSTQLRDHPLMNLYCDFLRTRPRTSRSPAFIPGPRPRAVAASIILSWLALVMPSLGLSIYPNAASSDPFHPDNVHLYGAAEFKDHGPDGYVYHYLYPGHASKPGMVLIDLPTAGQIAPDAFNIQFVIGSHLVIKDRAFSLNYGEVSAADLDKSSTGAGKGLRITLTGVEDNGLIQTTIVVYWGDHILGGPLTLRVMPVNWTVAYNRGVLNVRFLAPDGSSLALVRDAQVTSKPEAGWRFAWISDTEMAVLYRDADRPTASLNTGMQITASGSPKLIGALTNRTIAQDHPDTFDFEVASWDPIPNQSSFLVRSSNPAVISTNDISFDVSQPASPNLPYAAKLTLSPRPRVSGSSTITILVDQGNGSAPVELGSYTHTIAKNIPPTISALGAVTQPQGVTCVIPITVGSTYWSVDSLQVSPGDNRSDWVPETSVFIQGFGTNRSLVFTPPLNRTGIANLEVKVTDSSGDVTRSSLTLTVVSNEVPPAVLGSGTALNLNRYNDGIQNIRVPQFAADRNFSPSQGDRFTLEGWVNPAVNGSLAILSRGAGENTRSEFLLSLIPNSGALRLAFMTAGEWDYSAASIPTNHWTHIAVTYDGSVKRFYINGVPDTSASRAGPIFKSPDSSLFIGIQGSECQCNPFVGAMDEVRVWNIVRSHQEIQASMKQILSADTEGLLRYYRFEEGFVHFNGGSSDFQDGTRSPGGRLVDSSESSRHALTVNFPGFVPGIPADIILPGLQGKPLAIGLGAAAGGTKVWGSAGAAREIYFSSNSLSLASGLLKWPDYPARPDVVLPMANGLELPPGGPLFYGERLRGYLVPPESGTYTLSIASANEGQLWLGTNDSFTTKRLIAKSPKSGVAFRQFNYDPSVQGAEVNLTAGQRYYFEILHQAGDGTAGTPHLSVQWKLPSGALESPIPPYRTQPLDTAPANGALEYSNLLPPESGSLTAGADGAIYQSSPNFVGQDDFEYRVSSAELISPPARVIIEVKSRDDRPVAGSVNALGLDGRTATLKTSSSLNLADNSFTIELWARRHNPLAGQAETLWYQGTLDFNRFSTLGWQTDGSMRLLIGNTNLVIPIRNLDTNWHHYATVFDAAKAQVEIFRDGVLAASSDFREGYHGNGPLVVGSFPGNRPSQFFFGDIDEVRVWRSVRDRTDILASMRTPLSPGADPDLYAYYRLDEGNGLNAMDTSEPKAGIHLDATIIEGVTWIQGVPGLAEITVPRNSPGQRVYLPGFDFGGAPLTYQITRQPAYGQVTLDPLHPGEAVMVPHRNFHGNDELRYTVSSDRGTSAEVGIRIVVSFINIPPVLGTIRDQEMEEEDPPLVVSFQVLDEDDARGDALTYSATSSNQELLPSSGIVFAGSGTNRTITLAPAEGEVGDTTIEIEVSDGVDRVRTHFELVVNPRLAFAVVDIGAAAGRPFSVATALNPGGLVAGYTGEDASGTHARPFFYTGFGELAKVIEPTNPGGGSARALGLNSSGRVVGEAETPLRETNAFQADPLRKPGLTNLGTITGSDLSVARAINDAGLVVGYAKLGDGTYRAIQGGSVPLGALEMTNLFTSMWATAVNGAGQIVGHGCATGSGATNAFLTLENITTNLGLPPGAQHAMATGINAEGVVVGSAVFPTEPRSRVVTFDGVQWNILGDMLGGGAAEAAGINRFGQIVGRALTTNGVWHAFLYSDGRAYDLNSLIPEGSGWELTAANAINDQVQVAGAGINASGLTQATLLFPASAIGRRVVRPDGALGLYPRIQVLQGEGDDNPVNSFFWSAYERKLYAIRPVVATLDWSTGIYVTTTNETQFGNDSFIRQVFTNEVLIRTLSFNTWPREPQIHVANTPAQVQPDHPSFKHGFVDMIYTTADGATVDKSSYVFQSPQEGYSVMHYLRTEGRPVNPSRQPNHFTVVRTIPWDDPQRLLANVPWTVGEVLTNALHNDYPGLNGYVYFPNSDYDGVGDDAAHSRTNRTGSIIPVNANPSRDPLVVVWYQQDQIGTAWPGLPVQYRLQWPTNADSIVIASGRGTGPLDPVRYPSLHIYNQPDPALPGFNPNEEHALLSGGTVYALRDDLNARINPKASEPFVLVKYEDPATRTWRIKPYSVVAERDPATFQYSATAGSEIQAPAPISLLPLMTADNRGVSGPYWQDYHGRYYARAAGATGDETEIVLRYFYPLQPGFFYDLNRDGQPDAAEGVALPWLDQRPGGVSGQPVDVTYTVSWPTSVAKLQVAQTVTTGESGLPDILDMASAQIVFDSLNPGGSDPLNAAARLFDPLSPRTVPLEESFQFPESVRRENDPSTGYENFPDLPFQLRVRLFYDPLNRRLGFRGFNYVPAAGGATLTLLNVMNQRELEQIVELNTEAGGDEFENLIHALYRKTRNPNELDLNGDGKPDDYLLTGLTSQVITNGNRKEVQFVGESFGDGPKGLAAGQPLPTSTNASPRYVVVAENNDPDLPGLPVRLHVIQVVDDLYASALAFIEPDNVLDERVTLRHRADFTGVPENFAFQWFYQLDGQEVDPTILPETDSFGEVTDARGWTPYPIQPPDGVGVNDITLGTGTESAVVTLSDTWFLSRYGIRGSDGSTRWSRWIGEPSGNSEPRAMLVEGWIKRVLAGINLFSQRSSDFDNHEVNTLANALAAAGPRYERDVALNPDKLDEFGLIEIYETILRRGESLSINNAPPLDIDAANQALLLVAGRIADLYLLLGNEAFADAANPTIGLTTDSDQLGSLSSSIFAFEDQLDSLLEEELTLLRGRDDRATGVGDAPVYNRLFWNFTGNNGEVAYTQTYAILDWNSDGFINPLDAQILYPQGHGDAWGHYLTALTTYYNLLRNPNYTWIPRPERTLIAGVAVEVNYQDERRFARAAAAKAHAGAEIVERTHRLNYSENPNADLEGYADTNAQRAWGVSEWARRAGTGAWFDWVTANAILPPLDSTHTGIERIDRTSVAELSQIVAESNSIQNALDQADAGLNPLGVARGVVPFDIDPDLLRTGFGRTTHFEQIYDRAVQALRNAVTTFDVASQLSNTLRSQQDSESDFSVCTSEQEVDYRNRLVEVFGYPHAGDLGAGTPYPSDYDGPDLHHWMYIDNLDSTLANTPRSEEFTGLATHFTRVAHDWGAEFSERTTNVLSVSYTNQTVEVEYPVSASDYGLMAPVSWGKRRSEGRLQTSLRSLVNAQADLRQATVLYGNHISEIEEQLDLLEARFGLRRDQMILLIKKEALITSFNAAILGMRLFEIASEDLSEDFTDATQGLLAAIPKVEGLAFDAFAPIAAGVLVAGLYSSSIPDQLADASKLAEVEVELAKELTDLEVERELERNEQAFEVRERTKELEGLVREEAALRLDIFQASQAVRQSARDLESAMAEGNRVLQERRVFRMVTAGAVQANRYRDLAFRIFRNDALQKLDAQFNLASRYVYLAATAYDYELNLDSEGSARSFLADIVRERNLGQMIDGEPVVGRVGLASIMGRMRQNFDVLKGQLGLNNSRDERTRFSLRTEAMRILPPGTNGTADLSWRDALRQARVTNLWDVPEFRRACRPFAPEQDGRQPGIVLRFSTSVAAGKNFFGHPLGPVDSSYDPSEYSTRIRSVGLWFSDYNATGLSYTPRAYLVPVGTDILRSPEAGDFSLRSWQVVEQRIPTPFPIGASELNDPFWIPELHSIDGSFADTRRHSAFRAYHDASFESGEFTESTRLVGRSVWNSQWVLIIPGLYLLGDSPEDADDGLDRFIDSVSDIKVYFQTYSHSGN
jgi:probable HAF family extracellular repeat protein